MSIRSRTHWPLAAVATLALAQPATAQDPAAPEPKVLTVHPAPEPSPSLKYRLFPLESELNPGDAAPVYLRLAWEMSDEVEQQFDSKGDEWLDIPFDEFPADEARKFVDVWSTRLRQIDFAAHRQKCDWGYTLPEQREDVTSILLPDAQGLRRWSRLVTLKARVEIAEGKADEAVQTMQTSLAFARHAGNGPFLISALVGTAMANRTLDRVEELIARPDAPNLYWALTALPRPFIDDRDAFANEQKVVDWLFPELTDLDATRTPAEWDARLDRFFARMARQEVDYAGYEKDFKPGLKGLNPESFRAALLPDSKAYLSKSLGTLDGLADSQLILLYAAARNAEVRDLAFRPTYLPYAQARAFYDSKSYDEAIHALDGTPLSILGGPYSSVHKFYRSQAVLNRKIAALRAIEALRLHAAAHDGRLPETLDQIDAVPVPHDPTTGQPFAYRLEGDTATLSSPPPGDLVFDGTAPGLDYRITIAR